MKIASVLILATLVLACTSSILTFSGNPDFPSEREDRDQIVGQTPKKYKIYTNTSYHDKWRPVIEENMEQFRMFMTFFKHRLIKYGLLTEEEFEFIQNSGSFYKFYDQDFVDEIQAISDLSGISFEQLFVLNMQYEIVAYRKKAESANIGMCSAILAYTSDGEQIIHAKNLDFLYPDFIGKILIQFDYHDPETDQLLYSTSNIVGNVWANSFIRYGAYSVSLNERNTGDPIANIVDYILGAQISHMLLINLLETVDNYKEFVAKVQENKTVAGFYLTVASYDPREGGILIQKSRTCTKNEIVELNYKKNWFIVQTNHDLGTEDPDNRSTQLTDLILAMGKKNVTKQSIFGILQFFPNFNYHTIHTTMMNIQKGEFETTNWWA